MADKRKVFVSYSSKNRELVKEIVSDVQSLGYEAWFDQQIKAGLEWWKEIIAGIVECDIFLFAATPEAIDSEPCRRERDYARKLGKPIVPVALTDLDYSKLPEDLPQRQFMTYRVNDKLSYVTLQDALRSQPAAPALPDPLPKPPEVPISDIALIRSFVTSSELLDIVMQKRLVYELDARRKDDQEQVDSLLYTLRGREDTLTLVSDRIDEILGTAHIVPVQTLPELDLVLQDRSAYAPFDTFIAGAESLSIYGASAIIIFNQSKAIREQILIPGGALRVLLQNPANENATAILQAQLDDEGGPFLRQDIDKTLHVVSQMRETGYTVECRLLDFSPGFSLSVVDPLKPTGKLNVEFLGFSNISIHERMHIKISKERSPKWFKYWVDQYEAMWEAATPAFG